MVETLSHDNVIYAYICRSGDISGTTFITPPSSTQQAGFIMYPKNTEIPRHRHNPRPRSITNTVETLMIIDGKCVLDIYDKSGEVILNKELVKGDVVVIVNGGHGFRILEDVKIFEVKQGPYQGDQERERF